MDESTSEHQEALLGWVETWILAAGRQSERIKGASYDDRQPDVLMFVDAVNNVRRGAIAILGAQHPSVEEFDRAHPGLKDLRDMVEHFDAYVQGRGDRQEGSPRQKNNKMPPGYPYMATHLMSMDTDFEYSAVMVGDKSLVLGQVMQSAIVLTWAAQLSVRENARS